MSGGVAPRTHTLPQGSRNGTADLAALAATPPDDPRIVAAENLLSQSPTGKRVVDGLKANHVPILLMPAADFYAKYPDGRAGFYDIRTGRITAPDDEFTRPADGAIMLAHEGTHAIDGANHVGGHWGGLVRGVLSPIGHALIAPLQLRNPATVGVDTGRSEATDDEVRAYMAQARVEDDLHVWGDLADFGHNRDGSLRTEAETRAAIESEPLYQEQGPMRVIRTAVYGATTALIVGYGVNLVAAKLGHEIPTLPFFGALAAATGAMVLGDWLTHHDGHTSSQLVPL